MDPISLSIGVGGLVGTFTACVNFFDYLRVGCNLGQDYQKCILKLDLVQLRFTRWAQSVGIAKNGQSVNEDTAVAHLKSKLASPDKEFATVQQTLGQILSLFQETARTSERLASKSQKDQPLVTDDIGREDATLQALRETIRNMAIRRQKQSTTTQKISWALYRKRDFTGLIEELTELVSMLVELVPREGQLQLCKAEVAEIDSNDGLIVLDDVLSESVGDNQVLLDDLLHETVIKTIVGRKGSTNKAVWKRSKAGEGSRIHQGDRVASDYHGPVLDRAGDYLVEHSEFGKNVVFHQGNNYGGMDYVYSPSGLGGR